MDLKVIFTGLAVVSVVVVLNFLSYQYDIVYDFTQTQRHSLSFETIRILETLDQPVRALVFFRPVDPRSAVAQDYLEKFSFYTSLLTYELHNPDLQLKTGQSDPLPQNGLIFVTRSNRAWVYHIDEMHLTQGLLQVTNSNSIVGRLSEAAAPAEQPIFLPPFHAAMVLIIIQAIIPLGFLSLGLTAWLRQR